MTGKLAVITGASSGIGAAAARRLSHEGLRVALVARRRDRLEDLAAEIRAQGGAPLVIAADLGEESGRQAVLNALAAEDVSVLINNVGMGWYGYAEKMPWATVLQMMQVNLMALLQFTWAFLPGMKARNSGHIINLSSIAGGFPQQGVAMYSATKAFIDSFSTSLHRELQGTAVHVSMLRPGPVQTEFFTASDRRAANGFHMPAERLAVPVQQVVDGLWSLIEHPRRVLYVPRWMGITPVVEYLFGWIIDRLGPLLLARGRKH